MSHTLVVGAGPIGSAAAHRLGAHGHRVRLVSRSGRGPSVEGVELIAADAADEATMLRLATGADAVLNCVNPAYHRWATDWPPIAAALLTGAERAGAVLATASNLYGYGPVDGPITEDLPLAATGTKGRVRAHMFLDALEAHQAGRVRITEVRGSDYIGPGATSHLGDRTVPRVLAAQPVRVFGSPDQPHTWTFTHDMAAMLVTAALDPRAWGRAWHAPSNPPRTQREAIDDLADVAGVPTVPVRPLPPAALSVLGLLNSTIRELRETRYQFDRPFVMDSTAAQQTFGLQPTPWRDVLAETLQAQGKARASRSRSLR